MKEATIWTDGSCSGNPGPGGWAALIRFEENDIKISGNSQNVTNNQMELYAVIMALNKAEQLGINKILLFSDSQYVVKGITQWINKWKKNNWNSSTGKVLNQELWENLDALVNKFEIYFNWIKGHSTEEIELVDSLAKQQTAKILN